MSPLASLARAYERMGRDAAAFGYSVEKIGFLISLNCDGSPAGPPIDLREGEDDKKAPRLMQVPASRKRPGVTPKSFFLWDNTAFALGVSRDSKKIGSARFEAFRDRHRRELADADDIGLMALLNFVNGWTPEAFRRLAWPNEMKDANVVFSLESDRRRGVCIHDRPAARELWRRLNASAEKSEAICLVNGERAPIERVHPAIKGVWGAESSGASIVSFNQDSFTSYGHAQGDNAPVSEAAAFAYTTALNRLLERDSGRRIQIGDASTVFWADASSAQAASHAEAIFAALMGVGEGAETKTIAGALEAIRRGEPLAHARPDLASGVRFFVLGLSPNNARLSIRFYIEEDFAVLVARILEHAEQMRVAPPPKGERPGIWRLLIETAALRKPENIPPQLAGECLRAILSGSRCPMTLFSAILIRIRADHDVNALRVGILKAVLIRNFGLDKEVPVALDPENADAGYLLGRLFATHEYAQTQALGRNVNATIRDQYYGAASAAPRSVFPLLQRKTTHHLSTLRKDRPGLAVNIDRKIGEICDLAEPGDLFPSMLSARRQALFALGYYHQRNDFHRGREEANDNGADPPYAKGLA